MTHIVFTKDSDVLRGASELVERVPLAGSPQVAAWLREVADFWDGTPAQEETEQQD